MQDQQKPQRRLSSIGTRWSMILAAQQSQADQAQEARRQLLVRYCGAVYGYLHGGVGDPQEAEELTQEFALRFMRGDYTRVKVDGGRFRDFLRVALCNLITDHFRARKKRLDLLPADAEHLAAPARESWPSDEEFLRRWRRELLERAWDALQEEQSPTGPPFYTVLRWRVEQPQARTVELAERLSSELGRPITEAGFRQTLHRAREKFAELLLEEVAHSLETSDRERLERELIDLDLLDYCRSALARRTGKPPCLLTPKEKKATAHRVAYMFIKHPC